MRLSLLGLVLVLLGGAAGFGTAVLLPDRFAAHAEVLYLITREQPTGFLREDRNMTTQLVMLNSRVVLEPVADEFGVPVEELAASVRTEVAEESEVIRIEVVRTDQTEALNLLEAMLARYIEVSRNSERTDVHDYLDGELIEVLARINEVRSTGQQRQAELAPLVDREQSLRSRLDDLEVTDLAGPRAEVIVEPYAEENPVSPQPRIAAATGALGGLLLALLLAAVAVARRTARR